MDQTALRRRLESLADELGERVQRIDRDLNHREEPMSADFAEQVVEQENLDVLHALEDEGREELVMVRRALARMDSGDYGICAQCGAEINERRLEAVPYADKCINCAE